MSFPDDATSLRVMARPSRVDLLRARLTSYLRPPRVFIWAALAVVITAVVFTTMPLSLRAALFTFGFVSTSMALLLVFLASAEDENEHGRRLVRGHVGVLLSEAGGAQLLVGDGPDAQPKGALTTSSETARHFHIGTRAQPSLVVLRKGDVDDVDAFRARLAAALQKTNETLSMLDADALAEPRLSPETRAVLTAAVAEARLRGHSVVTHVHVAVALLRVPLIADFMRDHVRDATGIIDWHARLLDALPRTSLPQPRLAPQVNTAIALTTLVRGSPEAVQPLDLLRFVLTIDGLDEEWEERGFDMLQLLLHVSHGIAAHPIYDDANAPAGDSLRVVMHNDDYTTQVVVVDILEHIMALPPERAREVMLQVHTEKRATVCLPPIARRRSRAPTQSPPLRVMRPARCLSRWSRRWSRTRSGGRAASRAGEQARPDACVRDDDDTAEAEPGPVPGGELSCARHRSACRVHEPHRESTRARASPGTGPGSAAERFEHVAQRQPGRASSIAPSTRR